MSNKQEKKNDRTAWTVSIVVHGLLLIAFIFMVAWREPNPPHPEYGIQVNFGTDEVGSGDIQPTEPANTSESEEESDPAPAQEEVVDEQPVEESTPEEVIDPVVEETVAESTPTETITQEAPSPDVIEEKPETKEVVEPKKDEEKPKEQPVVEEKKKEPAKTPVLYEKKATNTTDGTGQTDADAKKANEGNDSDKTGDKGQEDGTLDARTTYKGNQGGGGGAPGLSMSGWVWDFIPRAKDTSTENGRIVFEVKIDDQGEIISVRTLERSVSAAVEKIYRQEVEKLTFTKTSDNQSTAAISTGTITFVIKSK